MKYIRYAIGCLLVCVGMITDLLGQMIRWVGLRWLGQKICCFGLIIEELGNRIGDPL